MRTAALISLATAVLAWDNKTIDTFYPDIVDPGCVVQTGNSSYSAIPVGSVGGTPDTEKYGEYNYCFMPHPRDDTYELPSQKDAQIVALTYVQRHQKRSAYHTFPEEKILRTRVQTFCLSCMEALPTGLPSETPCTCTPPLTQTPLLTHSPPPMTPTPLVSSPADIRWLCRRYHTWTRPLGRLRR